MEKFFQKQNIRRSNYWSWIVRFNRLRVASCGAQRNCSLFKKTKRGVKRVEGLTEEYSRNPSHKCDRYRDNMNVWLNEHIIQIDNVWREEKNFWLAIWTETVHIQGTHPSPPPLVHTTAALALPAGDGWGRRWPIWAQWWWSPRRLQRCLPQSWGGGHHWGPQNLHWSLPCCCSQHCAWLSGERPVGLSVHGHCSLPGRGHYVTAQYTLYILVNHSSWALLLAERGTWNFCYSESMSVPVCQNNNQ